MSDKPRERSAPATGPPPGGSAGGPRGCDRGGYAGAVRRGGGATGGQPPVGHGLGTLAAAFVPPAYNYLVGTSPVPVPGMSQQAHERERLLEEARLQMAWGIEVLHQQYYERVQQIYASMPVGGSGLSSSLMTQVGTGAVPVAGPRGCVPPAPRGQGTQPVPPAPREQGGSATRGEEFVRPVGRAPLRDCSNTGFQVVRRRRDGAPGPRPASAGRETGSRVSGASPSGSGVPRSRSHSRENVRPRASGPQGPRPQDAAPRKRDRSADSVGSTGSGSAGGRGGAFKKRCYNCHQKGHRFSECPERPSQPAATVSAVPAVASAGVAPSRDARAAAVVEPQQCFEEVRAAARRERAAALALAGLEPLVGSGPSDVALDPTRALLPGALALAGLEPSVVPGPSDVTLDTTQVLVPLVAGDLQLGAAVPEVRAPSSLGGSPPALVQVESTSGEPGSGEGVASSASCDNRKRRNKKRRSAASREQSPPSGGATPMEGLEEGRTQSPVEAVAMEVDGGAVEPLMGAYADLPLSPLPPEEDLLVLLGDKPAATEQNPSPPLQGTEQEGQLSLETFLGEKSPHSVTVPSEESLLPGPSVEPRDQSAEPGFQGEPQQPASGSLEEVPDVAPRDEEAGSAQPQGTSSGVRHQNALGTVDFAKCPYPSCRFERQGKKRSKMVDHALSSHLPWYVRGDVTCLQCRVPFVSAPQLERHLQDAHGGRSEEHGREYMDLMEDLLLFLARHLSRWNPTLEGLLLRARRLQRSGAISIPLNCSSNLLWVRFLERFGLPVPEVFSMESLNSIACLLHWRVLLALGACLPGKLKAEFRAFGVREGKPGVKQASASGQSRRRARPTKQSQVTASQGKGIPEAANRVAVVYNSADCLTDAHFHFHQVTRDLYSRGQGQTDVSLDMVKAALDPRVMEPCTIPLGAAVDSCMADAAGKVPRTRCRDPRVAMCFGGHPSTASQWGQEVRASCIEGLVAAMHKEKDRVVAIGEVGLDYPGAKTPVLRTNQELFLKEFLTAVRSDEDLKDLPLVLHVKDMSFDKQDASARCLSILKEVGYPVSHRIYRHSFLGTVGRLTPGLRLSPMWCLGRLQKRLVRRRRHGIFSARLALIGSWWKLMLLIRSIARSGGWGPLSLLPSMWG